MFPEAVMTLNVLSPYLQDCHLYGEDCVPYHQERGAIPEGGMTLNVLSLSCRAVSSMIVTVFLITRRRVLPEGGITLNALSLIYRIVFSTVK